MTTTFENGIMIIESESGVITRLTEDDLTKQKQREQKLLAMVQENIVLIDSYIQNIKNSMIVNPSIGSTNNV